MVGVKGAATSSGISNPLPELHETKFVEMLKLERCPKSVRKLKTFCY